MIKLQMDVEFNGARLKKRTQFEKFGRFLARENKILFLGTKYLVYNIKTTSYKFNKRIFLNLNIFQNSILNHLNVSIKKDMFNCAVFILNHYKSLLIGKIGARLKCENSRIIIEQNFLRIRSLPSITKSKQSTDSRHLTQPFKPR